MSLLRPAERHYGDHPTDYGKVVAHETGTGW